MIKFSEIEVNKKGIYGAKKPLEINTADVNNTTVSELLQVKKVFKCLIGYLNKNVKTLYLVMPKMSDYVYVKTFDDDKLSFCIGNDEL